MSDTVVQNSTVDNLIAGITHRVTETRLAIADPDADITYLRGTVMARNTVTNTIVPYVAGGPDGAGTFYGILANDVAFATTTDADLQGVIYLTGQFAENYVIFTGAGDIAGIRVDARNRGCFFESTYDNNVES